MTTLLCRLCWNSAGWDHPTGEARRLETNTYVATHGFGHEEWLFNHEWTIAGWRTGFIQGLNKSWRIYQGETLDIELYTRRPASVWCRVGRISGAEVLTAAVVEAAAEEMRSRGWLQEMVADLKEQHIESASLMQAAPRDVLNVRFRLDMVEPLDPPVPYDNQAFFSNYHRYSAYRMPTGLPKATMGASARVHRQASTNLKSETPGQKRGTADSIQRRKHNEIQNATFRYLKTLTTDAVPYEEDWIDLQATIDGHLYLFEVKPASTAKRSIREALGQLLEYAHYPDRPTDSTLVIVGEARPTEDDARYLQLLGKTYKLPLQYAQFDRDSRGLIGLATRAP